MRIRRQASLASRGGTSANSIHTHYENHSRQRRPCQLFVRPHFGKNSIQRTTGPKPGRKVALLSAVPPTRIGMACAFEASCVPPDSVCLDWPASVETPPPNGATVFQTTEILSLRGRMTGHADVNTRHHDSQRKLPLWFLQRTNSKTPFPRLHLFPLATMRCVTTTLHKMHHDLPYNKNHT